MLTFKEFLLAEYDAATSTPMGATTSGSSQTNVTNTQLTALQQKQKALLKKKADLQQKYDSDMQRAQSAINSLSEDQAPNPAAQPTPSNPAAQAANPSATNTTTQKDSPQVLMWKQKQQMVMKQKAQQEKQIDDELKRTQGQMDTLVKQQQKASTQGVSSIQAPPVSGMGTMGRSGNPEKTATPSGNKTTQSIAPSSRVGFGTSFK